MTAKPAIPINETISKRPWHRLHLSTWLAILLTAGLLLIVEAPGEARYHMIAEGVSASGGGMVLGETFLHGWPWEYLSRYEGACLGDEVEIPWLTPRAWKLFYGNSKSREFSPLYLSLDIAVCLTIIFLVAFGLEWRRRLRTRWFQFTLRELLLLVLLTAGVLSWWRVRRNQRIHELDIVNRFEKDMFWCDEYRGPQILSKIFGTELLSDFNAYTDYECSSFLDRKEADESISCLKEFVDLEKIRIVNEQSSGEEKIVVSDEMLLKISTLKKLQSLNVACAKITDSGLETISRFPNLKELNLCETEITSRGVRCLESTPLLEMLVLGNTKIDDSAAETLGRLENLAYLDVSGTKLTDQSVSSLERLSQLEYLDIRNTEISEKGYRELKSKLEDCIIDYKN